jgi:hypothetical protein
MPIINSGAVSPGAVYIQPVDNTLINTFVTTFSGAKISGASAQAASSSSGPSSQGTSFSLASEQVGGEDFCATDYGNRFKDCYCEESVVRSELQICYETSRKN